MGTVRRRSLSLLVVIALLGLAAPAAAGEAPPAGATGSVPQVTGPLPTSEASYPFGAADHQLQPQDLSAYGYVEEEYLVSGDANVYTWPAPGPATVRTADVPYTTRVLVRRPADVRRSSGNVVVEMLNPSNLFDLNIGWALMHRQMLRSGDVWVGVTVKPVSAEALRNFDPQRYGSLSFPNPLPLDDPANCTDIRTIIAGDSSRTTENGLAWDIYTQVGAWLRSDAGSNPVRDAGHRRPVNLYGFGYSQTGGYLYDYINGIQPLVEQSYGRPMYDAYLVAVAGGDFVGAVPINQCEPAPPPGDPRRQFTNVGVPILHVMSQSDYLIGIDARRPDSDAPEDRYRHYEMAGAGHATPDELYYSAESDDIVAAGRPVPPASCNEGPRSRFPSWIFFDAILRNLDRWVRADVPPPRVAPIEVQDGAPVLDEYGNVVGGLRSPFLDVPASTWNGSATGASFCFIAGWEDPFSEEELAGLYPSHRAYVARVAQSTAARVAERVITAPDGLQLVRDAAAAEIP